MATSTKPRIVMGLPARGGDFFGREAEQERFWELIESNNLMLLAPRRVGKTSLLRRLQENAADYGFQTLFLDVSNTPDELAFVKLLYEEVLKTQKDEGLWDKLKDSPAGRFLGRVKKVGGWGVQIEVGDDQPPDWRELGQTLADILQRQQGRWLVEVDELPVFLLKLWHPETEASRQRAKDFLYWLRDDVRLAYPDTFRWALAGSIGLDTVAARLRIGDAINDLANFPLGAFDADTADRFLVALAAGQQAAGRPVELSSETRAHAIQRVGWPIPYYLQLVFDQLRALSKETGRPCSPADVDTAFERLLGNVHRNYFDFWRQRLEEELGRLESSYAEELLQAACRDSNGASREVLGQTLARRIQDPDQRDKMLRYLLGVLENDGYGILEGGRFRFRSPLLREYWLRHIAS